MASFIYSCHCVFMWPLLSPSRQFWMDASVLFWIALLSIMHVFDVEKVVILQRQYVATLWHSVNPILTMVHSTTDIISCFEAEQRNTVFSALSEYLSTGLYVDISLVCKGQVLRAHKVVLSSSSKYFKDFFRHQPGVNIIDLDKELAPNDLSLTLEDVQLIIGRVGYGIN